MLEQAEPVASAEGFVANMREPSRAQEPSDLDRNAAATQGQRLLFLLSTLRIGGSERKIVRLANALAREGRNVTVAYLNGPDPLKEQLDARVSAVNLHRTGKFSFGALRRLGVLIRDREIDTVVAVNLYAMLYAALLKKTARRTHVRFFASLNTTDFNTGKARAQLLFYRPLLRAMDWLIFGAEYQRGLWRAKHLPRKSPSSSVLYNGVDTDFFCRSSAVPFRIPNWPEQRLVLGTIGMLRPEKSQDHLLKAIAELVRRGYDVGALIVGGGPQEHALRRLYADLHIEERVHFCGAARDVRPYLAAMDVFVLTSTAVETFSNAALEALAMECPVVSSAIGGMPEMLAQGGGWTYRTGDVDGLIQCLQRVIAAESTRKSLATEGRAAVVRCFSLESMVAEFRALIQQKPP